MSEKKTGDPAFPYVEKVITGYTADIPVSFGGGGTVDGKPIYEEIQHGGMTLRDYFAASALTGLIQKGVFSRETEHLTAIYAYELADAMLAEREK